MNNSKSLAFPSIGVGATYYGAMTPEHTQATHQWLRRSIPISEIHGCAYPEMSRGELCRQALQYETEGLEALVIVDSNVAPSPEEIQEIATRAVQRSAIVTASAGVLGQIFDPSMRLYDPVDDAQFNPLLLSPCSLCAIPTKLLRQMTHEMVADGQQYFHTPFSHQYPSGTDVSQPFFPLFSPFTGDFESLVPAVRVCPDSAFLIRAQRGGHLVLQHELPGLSYSMPPVARTYTANSDADRAHYALCVATFGGLDPEQQKALWELEKHGLPIFQVHGLPFIDLARDLMVAWVLKMGFAGMFMLDHDISFVPQSVLDIIEEAKRRDAIVGAPYCMRKTGHNIIGAFELEPNTEIPFFEGGGVFPASYTGMGFTAIPRSTLERTIARVNRPELDSALGPAHPLFALRIENGYYAGEDVSFCARVHDLNAKEIAPDAWRMHSSSDGSHSGRIFLDTRHRIFHKGTYHYGIEDAGIAVPRVSSLRTILAPSAADARALMLDAGSLSSGTRIRAIGLSGDQNDETGHPLLQPNASAPSAKTPHQQMPA